MCGDADYVLNERQASGTSHVRRPDIVPVQAAAGTILLCNLSAGQTVR